MRLRTLLILIVLAAALGAGVAWWALLRPERLGSTLLAGRPAIGGPFQLVDQHGRPVTDRDFRGRLMLVYFGYTFCPDVCPTELQTISAALFRLGPQADQVAPLFITVDPQRDTPAVLAAYLKNFSPLIRGLTGSADQVAAAARAYRVYYAKIETGDPAAYTVDHTSIVYLMDRDGHYLTHFSLDTPPTEIAGTIRDHL